MSLVSFGRQCSYEPPHPIPLSNSPSPIDPEYHPKSEKRFLSCPDIARHKVILLGDSASGKSSILSRFTRDVFDEKYQTTIALGYSRPGEWFEMIRAESGHPTPIVLVGNKHDLEYSRRVSFEEGSNRASELKASYVETSAMSGYNIDDLFNQVVSNALISQYAPEKTSVKIANIENDNEQIRHRTSACKC